MEELKIWENSESVLYIIDTLKANFPLLNQTYDPNNIKDVYSYYLYGHCSSFAYILYKIFEGNATIYDSTSHVIIKIGEDFYDVRGCINSLIINITENFIYIRGENDIEEYQECPIENFSFVEMALRSTDNIEADDKIRKDLIDMGKRKLEEISKTFDSTSHLKM